MAFYRAGIKSMMSEATDEGVGIAGGFMVGGALGRIVEDRVVKVPVSAGSTLQEKVTAWLANNGAKAALYLAMKKYDANVPMTREAAKALLGSAVYDTVLRLANHGYNPASVDLSGYRIMSNGGANVQKLVQENGLLKGELNKALQKLAGYRPDMPGDFKYAAIPGPYERQTRFGAMPVGIDAMPVAPNVAERQRRYGAMPFEQDAPKTQRERRFGFASAKEQTNVGALFNMQ